LYDKFIDERSGKDDSPANAVLVLNNSFRDKSRDTRFGNLSRGGGSDKREVLLRRKPAASPIAQLDSLSLVRDEYTKGGVSDRFASASLPSSITLSLQPASNTDESFWRASAMDDPFVVSDGKKS
jgi:hypothetical protein